MTTITIKSGLKKNNYTFSDPLQAIENMLAEMDIVLLQPVENAEILERIKRHKIENKDRKLETYDNI